MEHLMNDERESFFWSTLTALPSSKQWSQNLFIASFEINSSFFTFHDRYTFSPHYKHFGPRQKLKLHKIHISGNVLISGSTNANIFEVIQNSHKWECSYQGLN